MYNNKHYIRTNYENDIVHGFSDAFESPQKDDICINEQGGRHFELFRQANPPLVDENGVYLYRYFKGEIIAKSSQEIESETPPEMPITISDTDRITNLEEAVLALAQGTAMESQVFSMIENNTLTESLLRKEGK